MSEASNEVSKSFPAPPAVDVDRNGRIFEESSKDSETSGQNYEIGRKKNFCDFFFQIFFCEMAVEVVNFVQF